MVFNLIFIALTIYIVFIQKKNSKFAALLALTIAIGMNGINVVFVRIAGISISLSDFSLLICVLLGVYKLKCKPTIPKTQGMICFIWLLSCGLGVVATMLFPPDVLINDFSTAWDQIFRSSAALHEPVIGMQSLLMYARVTFYIILVLVFSREEKQIVSQIQKIYIRITKIHIVFCLFEIITKYIFHSNIAAYIRQLLMGESIANTSLLTRGFGYVICGFTNEASHLATAFFNFVVLCLLSKCGKKEYPWIVMAVLIMMLSMSFSTVMYFACILLIMILKKERKITKRGIFIGTCGILAMSAAFYFVLENEYFVSRIESIFEILQMGIKNYNSLLGNYTSNSVRSYGILVTLNAFFERPLFGLGIGTAYCNGGIVCVLANVGISGMVLWIAINWSLIKAKVNARALLLFVAIFLIPNIAKGDLDMLYSSTNLLWMSMIGEVCYLRYPNQNNKKASTID